jgi:hypothetical protein
MEPEGSLPSQKLKRGETPTVYTLPATYFGPSWAIIKELQVTTKKCSSLIMAQQEPKHAEDKKNRQLGVSP